MMGDVRRSELLRFEAPYVTEKLLARRYVDSRDEARALLTEALKFLWLGRARPEITFPMFSARVDEAWHQFALFTREYAAFCERYLGRFAHHAPSNAPPVPEAPVLPVATFDEFARAYREEFGADLPDTWRDGMSLSPDRKVTLTEIPMALSVRIEGDRVALYRDEPDGARLIVRVDRWAAPALEFVVARGVFFVRELPGLGDDDRVALCRALSRSGVLRPAR